MFQRRKSTNTRRCTTLIDLLESRRLLSKTIYVDASSPVGGTHSGASWADAYTDLQLALAAATSGDTIKVSQGNYKPTTTTSRTISFQLKNGVALYGGYGGYASPTPDARDIALYSTILSGNIGSVTSTLDNSRHVVTVPAGASAATMLDGFTVTGGSGGAGPADLGGAALYNNSGASPTVVNCTFTANADTTQLTSGSAVANLGGSPTFTNCDFAENVVVAVSNQSSTTASFTRCTFTRNARGAVINASSNTTFTACTFSGNAATNGGGVSSSATSAPKFINCVFVGNTASGSGGAAYASGGTLYFYNCTLANNTASTAGGGVYLTNSSAYFYSSILWGNDAPTGTQVGGTGPWTNSFTRMQGSGNPADPLFVRTPSPGPDTVWGNADDDYGDVSLPPWSPAIDAGSNADIPAGVTADLLGHPRRTDIATVADTGSGAAPVVDQGAYEAVPGLFSSAGGPYVVLQGESITLSGHGASTVAGTLTYAWEWTGDGLFDESTSPSPVFSTAGMAPGTITLKLRITDSANHSVVASTTLTVTPPVLYVDPAATGAHTGYSWADALPDLGSALAAAVSGQTLRVAQGAYRPNSAGDTSASFYLKSGVSLFGGYAGAASSNPDTRDLAAYPSILSGDLGAAGTAFDNATHVVSSIGNDATAVFDGFTVTAGNSTGFGGGLYVPSGTLTLANCTFAANTGINAALYVGSPVPLSVKDCAFVGNIGGAARAASGSTIDFTNCAFVANTSTSGGVVYSAGANLQITNCTFTSNDGGGIFATGSGGTLAVVGTTFTRNTVTSTGTSTGGAIRLTGRATATITGCAFLGNGADSGVAGAAIYLTLATATLANCLFVANFSGSSSTIYNESSSLSLVNSTFAANRNTNVGVAGRADLTIAGTGTATITNTIFRAASSSAGGQISFPATLAPTITYSDVQGGYVGTGNVDVNPLFVRDPSPGPDGKWGTDDDDFGDLHLSAASPLVDAGDSSAIGLPATDFGGGVRRLDIPTTADTGTGPAPVVDIGAYEAVPALAAHTGGPYVALQGQPLTLNGRGASTLPGPLTYAWEWTGDGLFDDAMGPHPTFPVNLVPPGGTLTISLRVTDSSNHIVISTSTIHVAPLVLYIDFRATAGAQTGTDWANAITDLAVALGGAIPGQTLCVATGTYLPTHDGDRGASFLLKNDVSLYGGYAGLSDIAHPDVRDFGAHPSVLSGDIGVLGDATDNSYHVVDGSHTVATAVLNGFTVTAGNADGVGSAPDSGGGLNISYGSPTIINCTFTANYAETYGGALYCSPGSQPLVKDSVFTANSAGFRGGAVYNDTCSPTYLACSFSDNNAGVGGALCNNAASPSVTRCIFTGNVASVFGGGIINDSSSPTISDCSFFANRATGTQYGGGAIGNKYYSSPLITGCVFVANSAPNSGGAIYNDFCSPTIVNCLFVANSTTSAASTTGGGAILCTVSATPTIANCTFTSNNSASYGGAVYIYYPAAPTITNAVFWGDSARTGNEIYNSAPNPPVITTYSLVQGGYAGTGNISADPRFYRSPSPGPDNTWGTADDDYGDLRLLPGSPCIDTGSNAAIPAGVTTDLAGNPRTFDFPGVGPANTAVVDMGAYELTQNLGAVHVGAGQTVALPAGGYAFSATQLIVDPGGTLDLADSSLVVDYTGESPLAAVRAALMSGRNGGAWNGTGIVSSAARVTANRAIGYAEASDLGLSTFAGQPVDGTALVLKYTLAGDANLDGRLNGDDFALADRGKAKGLGVWVFGDFDYEGAVTAADFAILNTAFASPSPPAPEVTVSGEMESDEATAIELVTAAIDPVSVPVQVSTPLAVVTPAKTNPVAKPKAKATPVAKNKKKPAPKPTPKAKAKPKAKPKIKAKSHAPAVKNASRKFQLSHHKSSR